MLGPLFGCVVKIMGTFICAVEIDVQLGDLMLLFMVLVELSKICFTVARSDRPSTSLHILDNP